MFSLYLFRGHFSQINFQSTHVIVAIFHVRGASLAVGISGHSPTQDLDLILVADPQVALQALHIPHSLHLSQACGEMISLLLV